MHQLASFVNAEMLGARTLHRLSPTLCSGQQNPPAAASTPESGS